MGSRGFLSKKGVIVAIAIGLSLIGIIILATLEVRSGWGEEDSESSQVCFQLYLRSYVNCKLKWEGFENH